MNIYEQENAVTIEVSLPIAGLAAVLPMAGVNDVRYYLNGVQVEVTPEHVTFVGTDGHTLAFAKCDCTDNTDRTTFIIARDDVAAILKNFKPENALRVFVEPGTAQITIQFGLRTLKTTRIDGRFPEWRQVAAVAGGQRGHNLALNAKFLGKVEKSVAAAHKFGGLDNRFVSIETNGSDRPVTLLAKGEAMFIGYVLMPARALDRYLPQTEAGMLASIVGLPEAA